MFRTNLRNAEKDGINFAGHYILTDWGCGTDCAEVAIIDAKTGNVFFPLQLQGISSGMIAWPENTDRLEFRPNSRLVILNGYESAELNKKDPVGGIHYFVWNGRTMRKIKFTRKRPNEQ